MLISHRKRFIFTKTSKTAGTSVECYFEPYCMPEGEWTLSHHRAEYVSEQGIIGYRGPDASGSTWSNHMPAWKIRDLIGRDVWNRYFKFTVVRNPFDKLISHFHMTEKRTGAHSFTRRMKAVAGKALNIGNPIHRATGKTDVERFRSWLLQGGEIVDRDKYLIDGKECVDFFIRYENLLEDLKEVCGILSVSFEPSRLPEFKKGIRHHRIPIKDYYDRETIRIARAMFAWEFERFGYGMPS